MDIHSKICYRVLCLLNHDSLLIFFVCLWKVNEGEGKGVREERRGKEREREKRDGGETKREMVERELIIDSF